MAVVIYRRGGGGGVKHCFSLVMYVFCSKNALYSASLSCMSPYFESNFSLTLLIKVLLMKKNMKLSLFFCLSGISSRRFC